MCTYATMHTELDGSAKTPGGEWRRVDAATVYFDHPVHAVHEHTLNIDITGPGGAAGDRIAFELSAESARRLVAAIQDALAVVPEELREAASA